MNRFTQGQGKVASEKFKGFFWPVKILHPGYLSSSNMALSRIFENPRGALIVIKPVVSLVVLTARNVKDPYIIKLDLR